MVGRLLNELVTIAKTSKTDFALHMNMTPSGLSKILTEKRLPMLKEKWEFCNQAANYFSQHIYARNCYLKLQSVFPIVYDFDSRHELEQFLCTAIEYALNCDFAADNKAPSNYYDKGPYYMGDKMILNILCILISDEMVNKPDNEKFIFYSSFFNYDMYYDEIFKRIQSSCPEKMRNVVINYLVDLSQFDTLAVHQFDILSNITRIQEYAQMNLWEIKKQIDNPFILLKGKFLVYFTTQIDGTMFMQLINHKSYLTIFHNTLLNGNINKLSYTSEEAIKYLEQHPSFVDELTDSGINAIYNFLCMGYLVRDDDINRKENRVTLNKQMQKLFKQFLSDNSDFYVSTYAMTEFYTQGKTIVPLSGEIRIPLESRITFLKRFNKYITSNSHKKLKIITNDFPPVTILFTGSYTIIYTYNSTDKLEKLHVFTTRKMYDIIYNQIQYKIKNMIDLNYELWDTYINDLTK
ncbi:hypothetical protein [uncultured Robinsoniella sp.]|uniref:hypothetical protein n=1 Tax=uncultured Robinsoniella sp. TaxID=904190 RepID=UPI00374F3C42